MNLHLATAKKEQKHISKVQLNIYRRIGPLRTFPQILPCQKQFIYFRTQRICSRKHIKSRRKAHGKLKLIHNSTQLKVLEQFSSSVFCMRKTFLQKVTKLNESQFNAFHRLKNPQKYFYFQSSLLK